MSDSFPYDIRLVRPGHRVTAPDREHTVAYAANLGPRHPSILYVDGWLIDSIAIMSRDDDSKKLSDMAKDGLEELPNLAYKFMLTYRREPSRMFDYCFLVATDDLDWWKQYTLLENCEPT